MPSTRKHEMLEALGHIGEDLGMRHGKESLTAMRTRGTESTKAPQDPAGSGGSEGHLDRKDKEPHHATDTRDVLSHVREHENDMDGPQPGPPSAHLKEQGNVEPDTGEVSGGMNPEHAIKAYLAKGYSEQDHAAHLKEHYDQPVKHMIGKHIR